MSYEQHDYLAVGCFGWGRAKTAQEAFRLMKSNASPSMLKPQYRTARIWKLADEVNKTVVSDDGSWYIKELVEGKVYDENAEYHKEVWSGKLSTSVSKIPLTFD